jgi:hypothetical protein
VAAEGEAETTGDVAGPACPVGVDAVVQAAAAMKMVAIVVAAFMLCIRFVMPQ